MAENESLRTLTLDKTEVLGRFPSFLTRDFQLRFFDAVFPPGKHVTSGIIEAVPGAGKTTAMVAVAFAAIVRPFEKRTKTRLVLYKSTFL